MTERRIRRGVTVHGRVQGVSFRWCTQQEAEGLGLSGWVRNQSDGTVRVEVEGPEADVGVLLEWLDDGPPAARVIHVEVEDLAPTGADAGFRVEH